MNQDEIYNFELMMIKYTYRIYTNQRRVFCQMFTPTAMTKGALIVPEEADREQRSRANYFV